MSKIKELLIKLARLSILCLVWVAVFIVSFIICAPESGEITSVFTALIVFVIPSVATYFTSRGIPKPKKQVRTVSATPDTETNIPKVHATHPTITMSSIDAELLAIDTMEGHDFEYWCADLLTSIGFSDVVVTQGSGDQGVDILAQNGGVKYAIQCKCYSGDLGNGPVQEVNTGKQIYRCQVGAVMTNRHFTKGAKEAAKATGTLLWDRDWIIEKLKSTSAQAHSNTRDLLIDIMEEFFRSNQISVVAIRAKFGLDHERATVILQALEEGGFITSGEDGLPRTVAISYEIWTKLKDSLKK